MNTDAPFSGNFMPLFLAPCPVLHIKQPQHWDEGGYSFQLHLGCQVQCVAVQNVDHPVLRADHQHADLVVARLARLTPCLLKRPRKGTGVKWMGLGLLNGIIIYHESGWWCKNHLEKYEFVNGKDDIPIYEMENRTGLKPPTRYSTILPCWALCFHLSLQTLIQPFPFHQTDVDFKKGKLPQIHLVDGLESQTCSHQYFISSLRWTIPGMEQTLISRQWGAQWGTAQWEVTNQPTQMWTAVGSSMFCFRTCCGFWMGTIGTPMTSENHNGWRMAAWRSGAPKTTSLRTCDGGLLLMQVFLQARQLNWWKIHGQNMPKCHHSSETTWAIERRYKTRAKHLLTS